MKKKNNYFLGGLLIILGAFVLAYNLNLLDFNYTFTKIASFWPVLLIVAGLAVLLDDNKSVSNPVTALLIALTIPLAIYSLVHSGVDKLKNNFQEDVGFNWDSGDYNEDQYHGDGKNANKNRVEQDFTIPIGGDIEEAKLDFGGGAAEFFLETTDNSLFEAKTLLSSGSYKLSESNNGTAHDIEFELKGNNGKNFNFSDNDHNQVFLKLNTKPIWDLEMGIGAGDLGFDLSPFKVKKLEVKTGAASLNLKLGDKVDDMEVQVKSGMAKVELEVPESVGCQIKMDGALNDRSFDGFKKVNDNTWESDNFKTASKHIEIEFASGLSSVGVKRY